MTAVQPQPSVLRRATASLVALLFPPQCLDCHAEIPTCDDGILLCADCRRRYSPDEWPRCYRCGAALVADALCCPWCSQHVLQFDAVFPLGRYVGQLRRSVLRMKRSSSDTLALALGRCLAARRREEILAFGPDMVVPIPLHWKRWLLRGSNHAETLARPIAQTGGSPLQNGALKRILNSPPQKALGLVDRFRSVRNAFQVRAGYDLKGKRVLLVDDVLTTGATCSSAATALKRAGAAKVAVAILARADHSDVR